MLGAIFAKILRELVKVLRFCPDFKGFCLDFHKIKTFGGAVAPRLLHQCVKQRGKSSKRLWQRGVLVWLYALVLKVCLKAIRWKASG